MTKRSNVTGSSEPSVKPVSPFAAWSAEQIIPEHATAALALKGTLKKAKSIEMSISSDNWYQDSSFIHLLGCMLKVNIVRN